jgi:Tfp pilus assembly protein PilZ
MRFTNLSISLLPWPQYISILQKYLWHFAHHSHYSIFGEPARIVNPEAQSYSLGKHIFTHIQILIRPEKAQLQGVEMIQECLNFKQSVFNITVYIVTEMK